MVIPELATVCYYNSTGNEGYIMERMTFDEMLDYASLHTSLLSGESLIINLGQLFIRYDEIRKRKRI